MEKVQKQIVVNVLIIVISIIVIFIAQTVASGKISPWREYLGDDFLLVLITSLGTTVGWRFSENIKGKWGYNLLVATLLFFMTMCYGMAMAIEVNDIILLLIEIETIIFSVCYVVENVIIVKELKLRNNKNIRSVGYIK